MGRDEAERRDCEFGLAGERRIVSQMESAQIHRESVEVEQLEPSSAIKRGDQPFIDAQLGARTKYGRSRIRRARGGAAEQAPDRVAFANRQILRLEPKFHRVHHWAGG